MHADENVRLNVVVSGRILPQSSTLWRLRDSRRMSTSHYPTICAGRQLTNPADRPCGGDSSDDTATAGDAPCDETVITWIQAGEDGAIRLLLDRYSRMVLSVGLRILRDRGEAEDMVQEVFAYVHQHAGSFDPCRGSVRTWLLQIAYTRTVSRRQYLSCRGFYMGLDPEDCEEHASIVLAPEDRIHTGRQHSAVRRAFELLPEKQRLALELVLIDGFSLREASERMNESLGNTRHHYYRGLGRVRGAVSSA